MATRKTRKRYRINKGRMLLIAGCLVLVLMAIPLLKPAADIEPEPDPEPEPREVSLTIRCAGDIMGHLSQLIANYDDATGTYDFSPDYEYVRDYIGEADLSLCNVETTFAGKTPYTGYPFFNSPDQLAFDVADVGFDVALFSNNHMLDTKTAGMDRTLEVLRSAGLKTAGARLPGEERTTMVSVGEVKAGIVSYTYETGLYNGHRTLNGSIIPQDAQERINSFRYYKIEEDLKRIGEDIDALRGKGADIVIAYLHWGNEYQRKASQADRSIAQAVAEAGADIIFASHPHVVQEVEEIYIEVPVAAEEPGDPDEGAHTGDPGEGENAPAPAQKRTVPVFYSMGNFISNQRQETLDNRYTEQGMIASVDLVYDVDARVIRSVKTSFIPTWVEKYRTGGRTRYAIVPLVGDYLSNPELVASGHGSRAAQALADMTALIGEQYLYQPEGRSE